MKTLNIHFEEKEYQALLKVKKERTWRQVLLDLTDIKKEEVKKENE